MKIYKAVHHGQLEFETRAGWALEQVLVHDHPVNIPHSAPAQIVNNQNNNNGYSNYQSGMTVPVETPVIVREPMFLLSKEDAVQTREEELIKLLNETKDGHKKWLTEHGALKKMHDQYKEEADRRTRELNQSAGFQQKLDEAKRKLEGDLAKVQKAIGDLKYFEIVGGPVPVK
jgi:hypothetical protein